MFKGIVFDSDGVLVDSMPYHAQAWVKVFEDEGVYASEDEVYEIEGSNHKGVIDIFFEKDGRKADNDTYEELLQKKRALFMENNRAEPFVNMRECLQLLHSRYKLAVASGADRKIVNSLISRFYPDTFDVVISGEDVNNGKPDPEPYLKAVDRLGLEKEECLVVENAPLGVRSAKNAGLYCVAVATYIEPEKLSEADRVFADHASLIDYLKGLTLSERE
ncbi:HAD family hydrolase [Methanolobus halotolerans]|uniref:HAD family phosphatase n=1 Tax=Methanolobus halotolerans TaxID=2052935 RepID=A0A4E0PVE3_9EURY|nr:HAD family phosphatase [Methanolobus halotolerans]TGC07926.1 HAD family phosphatase [Methanolobus halotolerans]